MRVLENSLVPIYENESGDRHVNGKDLHEFLGVKTRFNMWIARRLEECGAIEDEEFCTFLGKTSTGGRPSKEYMLSIDLAKEVGMMEGGDQGKKIRLYFIDVEKRYRKVVQIQTPVKPMTHLEIVAAAAQALVEQDRRLNALDSKISVLEIGMSDIKKKAQEAEDSLLALPAPILIAPALDVKAQINRLVRDYAIKNHAGFGRIYSALYVEFRDRHHIDLKRRAKGREGALDVALRLGILDQVYAVAHVMYGIPATQTDSVLMVSSTN